MNLLDDLAAFVQEQKRCGLLDSEVTRGERECRVTFECECGAVISPTVEATSPRPTGLRPLGDSKSVASKDIWVTKRHSLLAHTSRCGASRFGKALDYDEGGPFHCARIRSISERT